MTLVTRACEARTTWHRSCLAAKHHCWIWAVPALLLIRANQALYDPASMISNSSAVERSTPDIGISTQFPPPCSMTQTHGIQRHSSGWLNDDSRQ